MNFPFKFCKFFLLDKDHMLTLCFVVFVFGLRVNLEPTFTVMVELPFSLQPHYLSFFYFFKFMLYCVVTFGLGLFFEFFLFSLLTFIFLVQTTFLSRSSKTVNLNYFNFIWHDSSFYLRMVYLFWACD